tara:strand:+ start:123 stop:1037 length:915 start_codon:yes stop_codon:yes gene_type:complete
MEKKFFKVIRSQEGDNKDIDSPVTFIASTASVDRYGDIVLNGTDNWDLKSYNSNPVVLFNHDQESLPIGKGAVKVENSQLLIDVTFDTGQSKGAEIARMTKEGFLSAVSVGFQPLEYIERSDLPKDHESHGSVGRLFTKSELLEVSVVTIPAQAEAVAVSRKIGDIDYDNDFMDELMMEIKDWKSRRAKTRFLASMRKHILKVEEEENSWVVHFAKGEMEEELEEELEDIAAEEEESYLDKYLDSEDDEDDKRKEHDNDHGGGDMSDEDEDEEEDEDAKKPKDKNFNLALLRALTLEGIDYVED